MRRDALLIVLAAAGSALCWWPFFIIGTPDRSSLWFLPYPFIALLAGFLTFMSGGRWLRFVVASSIATFVGIFVGRAIWPDEDGIAQSFLLFGAGMATLVVALVSIFAGLVAWLLLKPRRHSMHGDI
jgi:uncharacterized membrane protein YjjP (DUF1212 family)